MPQAAELFKLTPSPANSSDFAARRLFKPQDASASNSPRFGEVLNRASQRTNDTENKPQPEQEDKQSTDATRGDKDRASATRGRTKSEKTAKGKPAKKKAAPEENESSEADATSAKENCDPAADAPAQEDVDPDAEHDDPAAADHAAKEPVKDPAQINPLAIAAQQSPQTVKDPAAPAEEPDDAETPATDAMTSDPKAVDQKLTAKVGAAQAKPAKAAHADPDDPDAADATETKPAVPPLAARSTARGPAIRPRDAGDEHDAAGPREALKNAAPPPANALPTGGIEQLASLFDVSDSEAAESKPTETKEAVAEADMTRFATPTHAGPARESSPTSPAAPSADLTPEARFAADNHEKIVTGVRGELLPNGGTMKLRLDPPELGTMQVSLHLRDGVVSASFQTANGDAAQLLSHSLSDLRSTLEAHGIVVDKLHVQQSPREDSDKDAGKHDSRTRDQTFEQQQDARREQQRKDMVQRMWDRLAGLAPIDLVA